MTTTIGPYTQGERPDPLLHTFLDAAGDPIDLTGYTPTAVEYACRTGESESLTCTLEDDPTTGVVRIVLPTLDIPGIHYLDVTATSAGPVYASQRFRYWVRPALPIPA